MLLRVGQHGVVLRVQAATALAERRPDAAKVLHDAVAALLFGGPLLLGSARLPQDVNLGQFLGPAPRFASREPRERSGNQEHYETSEPAPRSAPRTDGQSGIRLLLLLLILRGALADVTPV